MGFHFGIVLHHFGLLLGHAPRQVGVAHLYGGEVKNGKGEKEGMERPTNKGGVSDTIEEKLGKKG